MTSAARYIRDRGHATLREILENMCNLMRLGEYIDQILYKNCFLRGSLCIEQCSSRRVTCRYN